jgi:hypothetical protein
LHFGLTQSKTRALNSPGHPRLSFDSRSKGITVI